MTDPDPLQILVREATAEDAPMMADLTRTAWADMVASSSSGHQETATNAAQQLQDGGGFILFVNDVAAGSVRWLPLVEDCNIWEILRMGIIPEFRGRNLSQNLLEAVIHRALETGVSELRLAVRSDQSRLVDLYAAYGFEEAHELEYSHANPNEPTPMVMRRWIGY